MSAPPGTVPRVSIVLATLNERENLPNVLERVRRQPLGAYEVLVADDGSRDGTREFVMGEARSDARVVPVFHDGKQTTLQAQAQAIARARGAFVAVMDADRQHPPELLAEMIRALEDGAGLVVASRYVAGGSPGPRSAMRAVISRSAALVAKLLVPEARGVSDPVSGFFAFRRELFRELDPRYRGYKLLLFVLVMNRGRRCAEVGFRFEPRTRGASKVTETFDFVRVFLVESILARRLSSSLDAPRPLGARVPQPEG
jgi:dolichol-phosphate mannosyltransferase